VRPLWALVEFTKIGTSVRRPAVPFKGCEVMTYALGSRAVSWLSVHDFVVPRLSQVGDWPMVGTPAWCQLDDHDPVKWAALLDAAQHFAVRVETCQQARADASRDLSASEDWLAVAQEIRDRTEFYAARPWLRRELSVDAVADRPPHQHLLGGGPR
jgi:hypothetical protein